jgi:hypothetical protein
MGDIFKNLCEGNNEECKKFFNNFQLSLNRCSQIEEIPEMEFKTLDMSTIKRELKEEDIGKSLIMKEEPEEFVEHGTNIVVH